VLTNWLSFADGLEGSRISITLSSLKKKRQAPQLELAPLLDVIFILLIFFAVSTTLIMHNRGIKLTLPHSSTSTTQNKGVIISIDRRESLYFNKEKISPELLTLRVSEYLTENIGDPIILSAHKSIPYEQIIRTMDHIRLGGGRNITLQAQIPPK
jgi:biopolymer transport protein ExbD